MQWKGEGKKNGGGEAAAAFLWAVFSMNTIPYFVYLTVYL